VETHDRRAVKDFLVDAAKYADTDLTGLARLAGLSPSTLTRFVNGDSKYLPTTRTLAKIAAASGYSRRPLGPPDWSDVLEALGDLASAIGLNLAEAAILGGVPKHRLRRASEWMDLINRLPPSVENNAFQMLSGMIERGSATELDSSPGESSSRRRSA
jgi:transcriptional regulator with XRE-family HTH domain